MNLLFQFSGENPAPAWSAVNDGVMGGVSSGSARLEADGMVFSGNLSLENNGGFASVNRPVKLDLSAASGVWMRVRGDGRTYQLRFETDARFRLLWPVSFWGEFETVSGEWTEVFVPFDTLSQSWRGRTLSGHTFNPAAIERLSLLLADKQAGPFELEVQSIWSGAAPEPGKPDNQP